MNIPKTKLDDAKNVLLAGIGGGFDVFTGLPFVFNNTKGRRFILANCSPLDTFLYRPSICTDYPEALIPRTHVEEVYSIGRHGSQSLKRAYQAIIDEHQIDTVLAIDGGVDSLAVGDEDHNGTILEDFIALGALGEIKNVNKILCCAGFGGETEENMNHYRILENMASLIKDGYFLGSFSLTKEMPEFQPYVDCCESAWAENRRKSHIQTKIISATRGNFGDNNDYQNIDAKVIDSTNITFISILSSIYWMFDLDGVVSKNKIIPSLKKGNTFADAKILFRQFNSELKSKRDKKVLPL